jgi:hypothetical protein
MNAGDKLDEVSHLQQLNPNVCPGARRPILRHVGYRPVADSSEVLIV